MRVCPVLAVSNLDTLSKQNVTCGAIISLLHRGLGSTTLVEANVNVVSVWVSALVCNNTTASSPDLLVPNDFLNTEGGSVGNEVSHELVSNSLLAIKGRNHPVNSTALRVKREGASGSTNGTAVVDSTARSSSSVSLNPVKEGSATSRRTARATSCLVIGSTASTSSRRSDRRRRATAACLQEGRGNPAAYWGGDLDPGVSTTILLTSTSILSDLSTLGKGLDDAVGSTGTTSHIEATKLKIVQKKDTYPEVVVKQVLVLSASERSFSCFKI